MVQEYAEVQNQSQNRTEEQNRTGVAGVGVSRSAEHWSRATTTALGTDSGRKAEQQRRRNGRWMERRAATTVLGFSQCFPAQQWSPDKS
ncbi:hypothetical protein GYH30_027435 [Glycine max]|nr:hypothetical protein GYH30_027435 [Glycine max]